MTEKKRVGGKAFAILLILVLGAVLLTACFGTQVVITFNSDGGSECEQITVTSDMTEITLPETAKEGSTFDGWYTSRSYTERVSDTLTADQFPTSSVTYYAKWTKKQITISFAVESEVVDTKVFDYDATVTEADCPSLDKYPDYEWESFSFKANYDRTVTAVKVRNTDPEYVVNIYFPSDDGFIAQISVKGVKGTAIPDPGKPVYEGHEKTTYFSHWSTDEVGNTSIDSPPTAIGEQNLNIYAIFKQITDDSKFLFHKENEDGETVTVTGFTVVGQYQSTISIPSSINGKSVVALGDESTKGSLGTKFLQTLIIPETVKEINDYAFYGSELLGEVIFVGDTVSSIGEGAFANCPSLTKFELPDNVTDVGDYAFAALTYAGISEFKNGQVPNEDDTAFSALSTFSIGERSKLSYVGDYAFYGCTNLKTVRFGKTIRDINYLAFYGSGLQTVDFYDGGNLRSINGAAYSQSGEKLCYYPIQGGENYEMPQYVTEIADYAFYGNENLKAVAVGSSLKKIGDYAFYGCVSLEEADMSASLINSVGDYAFYGCATLSSAAFPTSLTAMGESAFENCSSLKSVTFSGNGLKAIKDKAFYRCSSLTGIKVPTDVETVGEYAFAYCSSMTTLSFGTKGKLKNIADYAFYESPKIETVLIPGGTETIGKYAFASEQGRTRFELNSETNLSNLTSIGDYAFMNTSITTFTIAKGVKNELVADDQGNVKTTLGKYVFKNCSKLTQAYFTPSDKDSAISEGLFYGCSSLAKIRFTSDIKSVGDYAFYNCSSLLSVGDWQNVTTIGEEAFYGCVSLANNGGNERVLPTALVSLGERAFYNCKSLKTINIPEKLTSIPQEAFSRCSSLDTISYDASAQLTTIGENAFSYCTSLKKATLPVELATRGYAESGATGLVKNPFYGCSSLKEFTFAGETDGTLFIEDGVVYRKLASDDENVGKYGDRDARAIYAYPTAKSTATYEVPVIVSKIDEYAFFGSTITGVKFAAASEQNGQKPIMFTEIGDYAFGETNVTVAALSARVYKIGDGAFIASKLKELTLVAEYAENGNSAYNVLNTNVNDNLLTVGAYAFAQTAIAKAEVPRRTTVLGDGAFSDCYSLSEITFEESNSAPNASLTLGEALFSNDNLITSVKIPNNVTEIGACAFYACYNLASVTFVSGGMGTLSIGDYAFAKAHYLYEIYFPTNLASLGTGVFDGDTRLKNIVIPQNINDKITSLSIPDYAFYGLSALEEIVIPSYVTKIGEGAFNYTSLNKVKFLGDANSPELVIGKRAFAFLNTLESVDLPDNLTEIGEEAFYCSALKTINYGEGKELTLEAKAFSETHITEFIATDRIVAIEAGCFEECLLLTSVSLGKNVKSIGDRAFYGDDVLTNVEFATSVDNGTEYNAIRSIGEESFYGTQISALNLTVKDKLTVGANAFSYASTETIELKGKEIEIGYGAFFGAAALNTAVAIASESLSVEGMAFGECEALVSLALKGSVITLGDGFAAGADELGSGFTFKETASETEKNYFFDEEEGVLFDKEKTAFVYYPAGKKGATFVLEENVTEIEPYAFYGADGLTGIIVKGDAVTKGEESFTDTWSNLTVYVPSNALDRYANEWKASNLAADETVADGLVLSLLSSGEYSVKGYLGKETKITINGSVTGADDRKYKIAEIGENAFANNSVLIEAVISEGIKTIGSGAFKNCTALESVSIGESVTSVKSYAFYGCSSLKNVVIAEGSSLIAIGNYAFAESVSLERIDLPEGVETIGIFAFAGDGSLREINVGNGLEEVGNNAFANCVSLNNATLPETIKKLGNYVFDGCENLVYVEICARSVCTIEDNTFSGTPESTYFFVPDDASAKIYKADGVWRKHISKILSSEERCSEEGFENYVVKLDGNSYTLIAYLGTEEDVEIKSAVNETVVITTIGEYAFGKFAKNVTIGSGVTAIADRAFYQTANLEKITFPTTLDKIGAYAFANLKNLEEATIVEDDENKSVLTEIGDYAFYSCPSLNEFRFPAAVRKIGSYAFAATEKGLSEVTFDGGEEDTLEIGSYAFCDNANLVAVSIAAKVTSIGDGAFDGCVALSALYLEYKSSDARNAVPSVSGNGVFGSCEILTVFVATSAIATMYKENWKNTYDKRKVSAAEYRDSSGFVYAITNAQSRFVTVVNYVGTDSEITFPQEAQVGKVVYKVTRIGRESYTGDSVSNGYVIGNSVRKVTIPSNVQTIGKNAFKNSESLEEAELTNGLAVIEANAFENCKNLKKINIPTTVSEINAYAFSGCVGLNEGLTFEESTVVSSQRKLVIGGYAFSGCTSLEQIYIPNHVTVIGGYGSSSNKDAGHTFENCVSLKTVTFSENARITSIEGYLFSGTQIEEIILPESLETVANYAFSKANALKRVVITRTPGVNGISTFTKTSENVFYDLDNPHLKVYVPETAYETYSALAGWKEKTVIKNKENGTYAYETNGEFVTLTDYRGTEEELTVPVTIAANGVDYTVSGIGKYFGNRTLKKIKFATGSQVSAIAAYAFADCAALKEIHIPDGVNGIGEYAFANCTSLTDVKLPSSLNTIKEFTFTQCTSLREIAIPAKADGIGASAFSYCSKLSRVTIKFGEDITIDNATQAIGNSAFSETGKAAGGMTIIVRDDRLTAFRAWTSVKSLIYAESSVVGDYVVSYNDAGTALVLIQYTGTEKEVDLTTLTLKGLKIESVASNAIVDPDVRFIVDKSIKIPDDLKDRVTER